MGEPRKGAWGNSKIALHNLEIAKIAWNINLIVSLI